MSWLIAKIFRGKNHLHISTEQESRQVVKRNRFLHKYSPAPFNQVVSIFPKMNHDLCKFSDIWRKWKAIHRKSPSRVLCKISVPFSYCHINRAYSVSSVVKCKELPEKQQSVFLLDWHQWAVLEKCKMWMISNRADARFLSLGEWSSKRKIVVVCT